MGKDVRILGLALALFIGQFIVIISLYAKLQTLLQRERTTYQQYDVNNPKLDSLKAIAVGLDKSLDSLQLVKVKNTYEYVEKIKYVYSVKDSASLDSLAFTILLQLDSMERAGYFKPYPH
jgi:predicted RND superfamily exporter protein